VAVLELSVSVLLRVKVLPLVRQTVLLDAAR
jgi:hypothetical protein